MLYGLETVSLRKRQESELEVAELKMLRFSLGVTRLDRIRNEYIRGTAHVGRLGDKVREARLRWFGHVQRRETITASTLLGRLSTRFRSVFIGIFDRSSRSAFVRFSLGHDLESSLEISRYRFIMSKKELTAAKKNLPAMTMRKKP
ncbi:hypothetical protein QTP70_005150 [Hemibagrus guttatus]|uniref:Uncharacterized protein n=1 Tax=Hemibagrus guttatus TaxID=175788 RepID=A0AAE0R8X9_9TELE|nr:hypothetical protein QTP70_005150 [Hemibagrus guttatus]